MKDLKQYTIESFSNDSSLTIESLLDDEDDLATNYEEIIRNFINTNYNWILPQDSDIIIRYNKKDGYIVDSKKSIEFINRKLKALTNGFFKWGKVKDFVCSFCDNLESLEGAPEECGGFFCRECKNLTSLEGAPKKCEKFNCRECKNLTSLEGAPKKCKLFICDYCPNLKTLKGAPQECDDFECFCNDSLISLEGAPKKCKEFDCRNCPKLDLDKFSNILYKYDKVLKGIWFGTLRSKGI